MIEHPQSQRIPAFERVVAGRLRRDHDTVRGRVQAGQGTGGRVAHEERVGKTSSADKGGNVQAEDVLNLSTNIGHGGAERRGRDDPGRVEAGSDYAALLPVEDRDFDIRAEGQLGVDALLLVVGVYERDQSGAEGDRHGDQQEGLMERAGAASQSASGDLADNTVAPGEHSPDQTAALAHQPPAETDQEQDCSKPGQERRQEGEEGQRYSRIPLGIEHRLKAVALRQLVDDDAGKQRGHVEV